MENQVKLTASAVTPAHVIARRDFVEQSVSAYGALMRYAETLNERDGWVDEAWYNLPAKKADGIEGEVKGEREALMTLFKEAGVADGTARKRWFDVRKRARELVEGTPEKGGSGEERPLDVALTEDGTKLYKKIARTDVRSEYAKRWLKFLNTELPKQGVDLTKI